jgi:hypothetical protein
MPHDVVAVDLGEDPPVLKPPVQRLVMRPHPPLHRPILRRICVVSRTFDFVGVAAVPLVGLDPLARLEEVTQHFVKYINVGILTGRVRPLDPHQVPREDVHPQLIAQGGLPRILMGREGVPLRRGSLLGDAEVRALHGHRAVVEHVMRAQPALEDNLRRGGGGSDGGENEVHCRRIQCVPWLSARNVGNPLVSRRLQSLWGTGPRKLQWLPQREVG